LVKEEKKGEGVVEPKEVGHGVKFWVRFVCSKKKNFPGLEYKQCREKKSGRLT